MKRLWWLVAVLIVGLLGGVAYAARQAMMPGTQYANELGTRQAMIPGGDYLNDTVSAAAASQQQYYLMN